jgi:hypothetical protein
MSPFLGEELNCSETSVESIPKDLKDSYFEGWLRTKNAPHTNQGPSRSVS